MADEVTIQGWAWDTSDEEMAYSEATREACIEAARASGYERIVVGKIIAARLDHVLPDAGDIMDVIERECPDDSRGGMWRAEDFDWPPETDSEAKHKLTGAIRTAIMAWFKENGMLPTWTHVVDTETIDLKQEETRP